MRAGFLPVGQPLDSSGAGVDASKLQTAAGHTPSNSQPNRLEVKAIRAPPRSAVLDSVSGGF